MTIFLKALVSQIWLLGKKKKKAETKVFVINKKTIVNRFASGLLSTSPWYRVELEHCWNQYIFRKSFLLWRAEMFLKTYRRALSPPQNALVAIPHSVLVINQYAIFSQYRCTQWLLLIIPHSPKTSVVVWQICTRELENFRYQTPRPVCS